MASHNNNGGDFEEDEDYSGDEDTMPDHIEPCPRCQKDVLSRELWGHYETCHPMEKMEGAVEQGCVAHGCDSRTTQSCEVCGDFLCEECSKLITNHGVSHAFLCTHENCHNRVTQITVCTGSTCDACPNPNLISRCAQHYIAETVCGGCVEYDECP